MFSLMVVALELTILMLEIHKGELRSGVSKANPAHYNIYCKRIRS